MTPLSILMKEIYVDLCIIVKHPSEWHFWHLFGFGVIDVGKMSVEVGG